MTRNQIEYWKNVEDARHNRAMEQNDLLKLQETQRSNQANERIQSASVSETRRANIARETETNRNNLAINALDVLRHDENVRHNVQQENIGYLQAGASSAQASAALSQAATAGQRRADEYELRTQQNSETVRHNMTMETNDANKSPWSSFATTLNKLVNSPAMDAVATKTGQIVSTIKGAGQSVYNAVYNPVRSAVGAVATKSQTATVGKAGTNTQSTYAAASSAKPKVTSTKSKPSVTRRKAGVQK